MRSLVVVNLPEASGMVDVTQSAADQPVNSVRWMTMAAPTGGWVAYWG
ncbi:hypothetical protein [Candidatus Poriferisodalis sp.]